MGAFLSEPVTDKISAEEEHERLRYGVCSMQGWRFTQEDNHSCFPKLTDDTSLFGVYDGHGGAEVSRYVASLLPNYVVERECWKEGEIGKALSEAFLALDAHLGSRKGLRTLKRLAAEDDAALDKDKDKNKSSAEDDGESEDSSEENVRNLFKEAKMPLEMLMAKYGQALAAARNASESSEEVVEDAPSASKSPKCSKSKDEMKVEKEEAPGDAEGSSGSAKASKSVKEETKEVEDGGGDSAEAGKPKENGLPEEDKPVTKNGSDEKPKLRSRENRIVYSDNEDDEDSSDEEYDENSSSLMEEEGEDDEESSEEDDDEDEEELERSIATSDEFALNMLQGPGLDSGCTAVVAVLKDGGVLYVANAGDSRCILSRRGVAVDMSVDHKPEDEAESKRIKDAGGEVTSEGRVNGGLNLSRALGDHAYKQGDRRAREQMISALPDVARIKLRKDEDEFMVLACDGIWNSMTSQDVVDFVREKLYKTKDKVAGDVKERMKMSEGVKLSEICGDLFDQCLAPNTSGDGTGCDNMTAILVAFKDALWKDEKADGEEPKVKEEAEKEEVVVFLTPPPSPPAAATDVDDEEESSEEEEEEELLDEEDDEEEGEKEEKIEVKKIEVKKEVKEVQKIEVKKEIKREVEDEEAEGEEKEILKSAGDGKGCKRLVSKDTPSKAKKQKVSKEESS